MKEKFCIKICDSFYPCEYGDDHGCYTSDPSGEYCKQLNPGAKPICKKNILLLYSTIIKGIKRVDNNTNDS